MTPTTTSEELTAGTFSCCIRNSATYPSPVTAESKSSSKFLLLTASGERFIKKRSQFTVHTLEYHYQLIIASNGNANNGKNDPLTELINNQKQNWLWHKNSYSLWKGSALDLNRTVPTRGNTNNYFFYGTNRSRPQTN